MSSNAKERPRSAASRVFLVLLAAVLVIGGVTAAFLAWETQLTVRRSRSGSPGRSHAASRRHRWSSTR